MSKKLDIERAASIAQHMAESLDAAMKYISEDSEKGALARAMVYAYAGYKGEARASLEQAVAMNPESNEACGRLIVSYLQSGEKEKALNAAVNLVSTSPEYTLKETTSNDKVGAYTLLGDALASSGKTEEAIKAYKIAFEKNKSDSTSVSRLVVLGAMGDDNISSLGKRLNSNSRNTALANVVKIPFDFRPMNLSNHINKVLVGRPVTTEDGNRVASTQKGNTGWCDPIDHRKRT